MQALSRRVPALVASVAILIGTSALVLAQNQPRVTEASATHVALLAGENMVPPVNTRGTGTAYFAFDGQTNQLVWTIDWEGLGTVTGAEIRGPAEAGANADAVIDLVTGDIDRPLEGDTELTDQQVDWLDDGLLFVVVETQANANGAIRGQIEAAD